MAEGDVKGLVENSGGGYDETNLNSKYAASSHAHPIIEIVDGSALSDITASFFGKRTRVDSESDVELAISDSVSDNAPIGSFFQIDQVNTGKVHVKTNGEVEFLGIQTTSKPNFIIEFVKVDNGINEYGRWCGTVISAPAPANSTDVNTGTDDNKFITSYALATSDRGRKITYGTAAPSGGADGDIYMQYTA